MTIFDDTRIPSRKRPLSEKAVTKAQKKNSDLPPEAWELVVKQLNDNASIKHAAAEYDKRAHSYSRHGIFAHKAAASQTQLPNIAELNKPKSGN